VRAGWVRGGYLLVRKSHWGWWPHFLWAPEAPASAEHFVPDEPRPRWMPKLWFRGHVKKGDA